MFARCLLICRDLGYGRDLPACPARRRDATARHGTHSGPGIARRLADRFALGLQAVPDTKSAPYVPLRSNAKSLVTGAPIAALRRRLKYASMFHDTLILESGILRMHAGAGNECGASWQVSPGRNRLWRAPPSGADQRAGRYWPARRWVARIVIGLHCPRQIRRAHQRLGSPPDTGGWPAKAASGAPGDGATVCLEQARLTPLAWPLAQARTPAGSLVSVFAA
jgi:hypothetical protein